MAYVLDAPAYAPFPSIQFKTLLIAGTVRSSTFVVSRSHRVESSTSQSKWTHTHTHTLRRNNFTEALAARVYVVERDQVWYFQWALIFGRNLSPYIAFNRLKFYGIFAIDVPSPCVCAGVRARGCVRPCVQLETRFEYVKSPVCSAAFHSNRCTDTRVRTRSIMHDSLSQPRNARTAKGILTTVTIAMPWQWEENRMICSRIILYFVGIFFPSFSLRCFTARVYLVHLHSTQFSRSIFGVWVCGFCFSLLLSFVGWFRAQNGANDIVLTITSHTVFRLPFSSFNWNGWSQIGVVRALCDLMCFHATTLHSHTGADTRNFITISLMPCTVMPLVNERTHFREEWIDSEF